MGAYNTGNLLRGTVLLDIEGWNFFRWRKIDSIQKPSQLHYADVQFCRHHIQVTRGYVRLCARHRVNTHWRPINRLANVKKTAWQIVHAAALLRKASSGSATPFSKRDSNG